MACSVAEYGIRVLLVSFFLYLCQSTKLRIKFNYNLCIITGTCGVSGGVSYYVIDEEEMFVRLIQKLFWNHYIVHYVAIRVSGW